MTHKMIITTSEWLELDSLVTKSLANYARQIADESVKGEPDKNYLADRKRHYELLKGIERALINEEELSEAEVYALERDPAYAAE